MSPKVPGAIRNYRDDVHALEARGAYGECDHAVRFQLLLEAVGRRNDIRVRREERVLLGGSEIRVDGDVRDAFNLRVGLWESKSRLVPFEAAVQAKLDAGYPTRNLLFENGLVGILYQDDMRHGPVDITDDGELERLLERFLSYRDPRFRAFNEAVREFGDRIPAIAGKLRALISAEQKSNRDFRARLEEYRELCRVAFHRGVTDDELHEMLCQHLLTERIFASVFDDREFVARNPVAAELEKVARNTHFLTRSQFLKPLDPFYRTIEETAQTIERFSDKQHFLHTVYETFFRSYSVDTADTHGIVYTPDAIVYFMVQAASRALDETFGKRMADEGVHILDPCTGTGTFITRILNQIDPPHRLPDKFRAELHCNEVLLLPYYIAAQNIDHEFYRLTRHAETFPGLCFADSLDIRSEQLTLDSPENTLRVQRQNGIGMSVVIGNPPYNVGQQNENDNNRNRRYPELDRRIRETYGAESTATNRKALGDMYVRFFRYASDRLAKEGGVICLVTNNSFVHDFAFDGMRKALVKEFSSIHVLDLGGNVRKNPWLSGTTHNVFGIQVGVAITLLVRRGTRDANSSPAVVHYHAVPEEWTREARLQWLDERADLGDVPWTRLYPDKRGTWLTDGLDEAFTRHLPLGTPAAKRGEGGDAVFRRYSLGVVTNRDAWVYDFHRTPLAARVRDLVHTYNGEVARWRALRGSTGTVDDFVLADERRIKWSRDLKADLKRGREATWDEARLRTAQYRPFAARAYYFDAVLSQDVFRQPSFFPDAAAEAENRAICVTDSGSEKPFMALMVARIPDLHLAGPGAGTQCFPFYTYRDGVRRENVRDETLAAFQARYGAAVTRWDVFHYVYGLLHAPGYRARYAADLRRDLPHVPFVAPDHFVALVAAGRALGALHVGYESADPYPLEYVERRPFSWRVERMRLDAAAGEVRVNPTLTLRGIPPEAHDYAVGARTALEWVVDQFRVRTDRRSGIVHDPNDPDHPQAIADLVRRVVGVSVRTVEIVSALPDFDPLP